MGVYKYESVCVCVRLNVSYLRLNESGTDWRTTMVLFYRNIGIYKVENRLKALRGACLTDAASLTPSINKYSNTL